MALLDFISKALGLHKEEKIMTVESKIQIYEQDGKEFRGLDYPTVTVRNVRTFSDTFVEIEVEGVRYKVVAKELQMAIQNAQNAR